MIQFADEVRPRIVSKFLSDISRILLNLLKYFNDTVISTFRVPALPVLFIILDLNLNKSQSVLSPSSSSSLEYCNKPMFWNN